MSTISQQISNHLKVLLFTAPLLIPLVAFWLVPFGYSIYISFTDWDYISPEYDFIGLENYQYMVEDFEFTQALLNTFWFSLGVVIPTVVLGLIFALLLLRAASFIVQSSSHPGLHQRLRCRLSGLGCLSPNPVWRIKF